LRPGAPAAALRSGCRWARLPASRNSSTKLPARAAGR
jgi:hypothetical protein